MFSFVSIVWIPREGSRGESLWGKVALNVNPVRYTWGFDTFAFPMLVHPLSSTVTLPWCREAAKAQVTRQCSETHGHKLVDGEEGRFVFEHEESGTSIRHWCT